MKLALITFSNNYDMQEHMYSMYDVIKNKIDVITVGSNNLLYDTGLEVKNYVFSVPERPGIELNTLNMYELSKIIKVLNEEKVDNILFVSSHIWNLLLIGLLRKKIKYTHIIHDAFPHEKESNEKNILLYNKYVAKTVDAIILHNNNYMSRFNKEYNYKKNLFFIEPWMKYMEYSDIKGTNKCLFFGRINPYKGLEHVLNIAQNNNTISIDIVGKLSKELNYLEREIKSKPNINFINEYVTEETSNKFFYDCDIVILPYNSATQSGVVIEAYRHSRPVIAFNVGALSEQINDEETGYLISSSDIKSFESKLNQYLKLNLVEKRYYCQKSWKYGYDKFSVEAVSRKLIDILKKINA